MSQSSSNCVSVMFELIQNVTIKGSIANNTTYHERLSLLMQIKDLPIKAGSKDK